MLRDKDFATLKHTIHALPESDRAKLRTYVLTVFDVRGRDTRVNLSAEERDHPRLP